jgi:hypothetical protein
MVLIRETSFEWLVGNRETLSPFQALVQLVSIEPLERHKSHPGVCQDVVDLLRTDDDRVLREQRAQGDQQDQSGSEHKSPLRPGTATQKTLEMPSLPSKRSISHEFLLVRALAQKRELPTRQERE